MNKNELLQLKELYIGLAAYYQKEIKDLALEMYAKDLSHLNFNDVVKAIDIYRKNSKNKTMPLPANLMEIISPDILSGDIGQITCAQINKALSKKGSWWGVNMEVEEFKKEMEEYLGEIGTALVQRMGGWSRICQRANEANMDIFNAQMRELATSLHRMQTNGINIRSEKFIANKPKEQIENERRNLLINQALGKQKEELN